MGRDRFCLLFAILSYMVWMVRYRVGVAEEFFEPGLPAVVAGLVFLTAYRAWSLLRDV